MKDGKATGPHVVFASGFNQRVESSPPADPLYRRPAGLVEMRDGSLLVSEDQGGHIFRIVYTGR
jgi:glucose/arabinose dehydrogenase